MAADLGAGTPWAVVIVSYNSEALLPSAIGPWLDAGLDPQSVVVVDNASADRSVLTAEAMGCRVLRNQRNEGFARAVNRGVAEALQTTCPDWLLVVNPDTVARAGLRDFLERLPSIPAHVGVVLPHLSSKGRSEPNTQCYPNLRAAARWLWDPTGLTSPRTPYASLDRNFLVGSVLVIRRRTWLEVGGLDERFFLYGEDADLSARLNRGGHQVVELDVPLSHHGNAPLIDLPRVQQRWMIESIALFNRLHSTPSGATLTLVLIAMGCVLRATMASVRPARSTRDYLWLAGIAARCAMTSRASLERQARHR